MKKPWQPLFVLLFLSLSAALRPALRLDAVTPLLNAVLKRELAGVLQGDLRFGRLRTDMSSFVEVGDLTLRDAAGVEVAHVDSARLDCRTFDFLLGRKSLRESLELVTLTGLKGTLIRDASGRWNLADLAHGKGQAKPGGGLPSVLPLRILLKDSVVSFQDKARNFHSDFRVVEGEVGTRDLPRIAFSLRGRTDAQKRDNIILDGEWDSGLGALDVRVRVQELALRTYLNYVLPPGGPQFQEGEVSLDLRVHRPRSGSTLDFAGHGEVHAAALRIPGVRNGLTQCEGAVEFSKDRVRLDGVRAFFLGARWTASGEVTDMASPKLDLALEAPSVPLAALSNQIKGMAPLALSGTAALSATIVGRAADPRIQGEFSMPSLRISGIDLQGIRAGLLVDKAGLKVEPFEALLLGGPAGGSAELVFPGKNRAKAPGKMSAHFHAAGLDLARWAYKDRNYFPVTGTASLDAVLTGSFGAPHVEATLQSPRAFLGGADLGALAIKASLASRDLRFQVTGWSGKLQASLDLNFEKTAEFRDSKAVVSHLTVEETASILAKLGECSWCSDALRSRMQELSKVYQGWADVELVIGGKAAHPDLALHILRHEGRFRTEPGQGVLGTMDPKGVATKASGYLRLEGGRLICGTAEEPFGFSASYKGHDLRGVLAGVLPLAASGVDAAAGALAVTLTADLRVLEAFKFFQGVSGEGSIDLKVGGSVESPTADGSVRISKVAMKMPKHFRRIKNGEATLLFQGQDLQVQQLSFESEGKFSMEGELDFSSGWPLYGTLEAFTDGKGLAMDDLAGMLDGYMVLGSEKEPLVIDLDGEEGIKFSGRVKVHDTVFRLPPLSDKKREYPLPISFDLRAEIGSAVWVKKQEEAVNVLDLVNVFNLPNLGSRWIQSVGENYRSPAFELLLAPTQQDFVVKGTLPDLRLTGTLGIARGTLHYLENDFQIDTKVQVRSRVEDFQGDIVQDSSLKTARVVFSGGRQGAVNAVATSNLRYYVDNPLTGRPETRSVKVSVIVAPVSQDVLEAAGLQDSFLNYSLDFDSDPPLGNGKEQRRGAILSLLVLGVPLENTSTEAQVSTAPEAARPDIGVLFNNQAGKFLSKLIRKTTVKYLSWSSKLVDYFRVAPKVRLQGAVPRSGVVAQGGSLGVSQRIQDDSQAWNWLFEVGKSVYDDLFVSLQTMIISDQDVESARFQNSGQVNKEVRKSGLRGILEYRFTPTRLLELSYCYSIDDNLEPVAFNPNYLLEAHRARGVLRNTTYVDNYTSRTSRQRKNIHDFGKEL